MGVNVNSVAPGFIDTEMTHGLKDEQRQQIERRSALRRLAGVEDVANAVEYLLGEKAKNITGRDHGRRREYGMSEVQTQRGRQCSPQPKPGCARWN